MEYVRIYLFILIPLISFTLMIYAYSDFKVYSSIRVKSSNGLTPHDPIVIIGDSNFTSRNGVVGGSGTPHDPYIIEGWLIDATGYDYGIYIENTTRYIVIRNCKIIGASIAGIYLKNTTHITIQNTTIEDNNWAGIALQASHDNVINNTVIQNNKWHGIYLGDSINISINNNIVENSLMNGITLLHSHDNVFNYNIMRNNGAGIYLDDSSNNVFNNNTVENNWFGIYLYNSTNNLVDNITIRDNNRYGIVLCCSDGNVISNVVLIDNGLFVWDSYSNSVYNNTVNGKPLVYLEDAENVAIDYPVGQIILVNCSNVTIRDQNISNTDTAIQLWRTNNTVITSTTIESNKHGIQLDYSCNNVINNTVIKSNSEVGIYLYGSSHNMVNNGVVWGNGVGIRLDYSSNNLFYHNCFIDNSVQVVSNGYPNIWDAGYPAGGNYWSDYNGTDQYSGSEQNKPGPDGIGDTPYIIDENNTDRYPLMNPPKNLTMYTGYLYGLEAVYIAELGTMNYTWKVGIVSGTGVWRIVFHGYNSVENYTLNVSETPYKTAMNYIEEINVGEITTYVWWIELYSPEDKLVDNESSTAEITLIITTPFIPTTTPSTTTSTPSMSSPSTSTSSLSFSSPILIISSTTTSMPLTKAILSTPTSTPVYTSSTISSTPTSSPSSPSTSTPSSARSVSESTSSPTETGGAGNTTAIIIAITLVIIIAITAYIVVGRR